eukprot:CAMPEP_0202868134 /NCGR_PEP_ID=MMETSP1391-20130828/10269_1 /ASSEMBLY_ACC=CAM_ASM_000867 /TAXON_ID=1034604 /ORGANISM="Chlamydomonas leiostraca, Strain SAG 11-49" /LENGTH=62 /DNA_ID=CAMNT_0049548255 /DNA_START=373 /DNA_END=561 /DNA_ORIENTATION=-
MCQAYRSFRISAGRQQSQTRSMRQAQRPYSLRALVACRLGPAAAGEEEKTWLCCMSRPWLQA